MFYRAMGKERVAGRICKRRKRRRVLPDNKLAGQLSLYCEPSDNSAGARFRKRETPIPSLGASLSRHGSLIRKRQL
jgi:hypothetical protein